MTRDASDAGFPSDPEKPLVFFCSCDGSMSLDEGLLLRMLGEKAQLRFAHRLCRDEAGLYQTGLAHAGAVLVGCTQEEPLFRELAETAKREADISFFNIRELAGWSRDGQMAGPKMAALAALALYRLEEEPAPAREVMSEGRVIISGPADPALELAAIIADATTPTVVIPETDDDTLPPLQTAFPIMRGKIVSVSGHFTDFSVTIADAAPLAPWSRHGLSFMPEAREENLSCDIVVEIGQGLARFAPHGRSGYLHVDPARPGALLEAATKTLDLVGKFDTIIHAQVNKRACAHARNGLDGCQRCLQACPHGAISPSGDAVLLDPLICEGCGDCAAVCPGDAIVPNTPRRGHLVAGVSRLLSVYRRAGGEAPVVLFAGERHAMPLLAAMARFGKGLPANVLPVLIHAPSQLSHVEMLTLMVAGAGRIALLLPRARAVDMQTTEGEIALVNAFMQAFGFEETYAPALLASDDPFEIEEWLHTLTAGRPVLHKNPPLMAGKRALSRFALEALRECAPRHPQTVPLPAGAPYGEIRVDREKCTVCLACAASCPTGALSDNPERPQLRFSERTCVQCGICKRACPEGAVSLSPRYAFTPEANDWRVLAEDSPMNCVACGKPFGTRRAVERVMARLAAMDNPRLSDPKRLSLLRYCEDCRVIALAQDAREDAPFSLGDAPVPRVTEDYLEDGNNDTREE